VFDHVTVRAADRVASERFYRTTLGAIGIEPSASGDAAIAWDDFALRGADASNPPTCNLHLAFVASSRERVDEFWRAGRAAGHRDAGGPGERPEYTPSYYGAFLRDPDGNSAEAVHHADVRRGGHLDHLWIRVADLDAAAGFYGAIMRHAGLRPGRRWPQGVQFRGAWATFSLVADGSHRTENLELAFPAPDRPALDEFRRAALDAGGSEAGTAGPRPPSRGVDSVFVRDPDGNRVGLVAAGGRGRGEPRS
jgi:catechol 2,3-dioxygenase-like lactoylglutathione lyase family enzyme